MASTFQSLNKDAVAARAEKALPKTRWLPAVLKVGTPQAATSPEENVAAPEEVALTERMAP